MNLQRRVILLILLLAACTIAGCAVSYRAYSKLTQIGYYEEPDSDSTWVVIYGGPGRLQETVGNTFVWYRSAEYTLERGFTHFRTIKFPNDSFTEPAPMGTSWLRIQLASFTANDTMSSDWKSAAEMLKRLEPIVEPFIRRWNSG